MVRIIVPLLLVALAALALRTNSSPVEEFTRLHKEFDEALTAFTKKLDEAKTDEERKQLLPLDPGPQFAERFIAFARKHPQERLAFDALVLALGASGGPQNKEGHWGRALQLLQEQHMEREEIAHLITDVAVSGDEASLSLLRAIIEKHPSKKVQARACKALIDQRREVAEMAEHVRKDDTLRQNIERLRGKAYIEKVLAEAEQARKEHEQMAKLLKEKYAEFVVDLSIGKVVPEVASKDLDGKDVKLSNLRGKVVVLDLWATWCPPCRAMIPHTREMVERHKDKPFVFVSISLDQDAETVKDFQKREPMPWTHWFNGPSGGIADDWDIKYLPAVFVLDAKGVIRFKDLRDKDLDRAVEELLKEMEQKKD